MAYTAAKPKLAPDSEDLRRRIPGWGVDLNPQDRPAVPKEKFDPGATGAHWDFPDRQVPRWPREKSTEHQFLTPVFGTSCPPKGLSGAIRRFAYNYSEGRARHWLLLMLADRVDVLEHLVGDLFRGRPDNFIAEYGVRSEFTHNGLRSRIGQRRWDVRRIPLELVVFAGVGLAVAGMVARRRRR
jgi:hypothetical protein